jgi:hypothetical protein
VPAAYRRVLEDRLIEATPAPVAESVLLPLARESVVAAPHASDAVLATIADLRSGDRARVERALAGPLSPEFAAYAIPLVAWAPVAALAATRLRELAPKITGLLIDAVMDPDTDFGVRRRLPALIAVGDPGLAAHGLWRALADARFEVRYRAGRALAQLHDRGAALPTSDDGVFEAIEREVLVDARIWRGYHLLDEAETTPADERLHDVLEQRSLTALDHVFALLGLVLPAEPVRRALHALRSDDAALRGTALEYLERVLPPRLRERLWPFLELERQDRDGGALAQAPQTPQQLVSELGAAFPSVLANL